MNISIEARICDISIKLAKLTKYPTYGGLAYRNIFFQSLRSIITTMS